MQRVPVLMYHSVADGASSRFKPFTVAPALFAEHMAVLSQRRAAPITLSRFVQAMERISIRSMEDPKGGACKAKPGSVPMAPPFGSVATLPDRAVILTFDDGFADFHTHALPVLERYAFPATLFAATAYIGQTSRWLEREGESDRPMLSWEQLTDAASRGIECGGHGHLHIALDTAPETGVIEDLTTCKRLLEERLARPVDAFAYPFGYYTPATQRLVRAAGYTSACAVRYDYSSAHDDRFAIARLPVGPDTTAQQLADLLDGRPGPALSILRHRSTAWRLIRHVAPHVMSAKHRRRRRRIGTTAPEMLRAGDVPQ